MKTSHKSDELKKKEKEKMGGGVHKSGTYETVIIYYTQDFFFVPRLVTQTDLTSFLKQHNLNLRSLGISFKFHSSVLPPAIGFRFISCCVEMWEVAIVTYENQRMLFSGMTCVYQQIIDVVGSDEGTAC